MPDRTLTHGAETSECISEASRTPDQLIQLSLHHLQQRQRRHRRAGRLEVSLRKARACPACSFNSGVAVIINGMTLFY